MLKISRNEMKHKFNRVFMKNRGTLALILLIMGLSIPIWFVSAQNEETDNIGDDERVETNDSKGLEYITSPEACVVPPSGLLITQKMLSTDTTAICPPQV